MEVIENKGANLQERKADGRKQKAGKGETEGKGKGPERAGGCGVENSRPMLSHISYSVKSFYSTSILRIDTRIRTEMT